MKTGAALDAELFRALERRGRARRRDASLLESVVATCCAAKARIVERDEREETGLRMVLNYGHTIGHALEALSGYRRWTHGEAVAIGMAAAGRLAVRMGWVGGDVAARQDALLQAVGLPTRFSAIDPREIVDALRHDKKARDGRVPFILMRGMGRAEACHEVSMDTVVEVLREIQE